ncbi:MAG: hypothetical protein O7B35_01795 [Deltaproteobacteria bacterium]|nr:hypothetical protein [Deltaproteobacteria bacterium]
MDRFLTATEARYQFLKLLAEVQVRRAGNHHSSGQADRYHYYYHTPRLAAGTEPMGFPKGRSGSSPPLVDRGVQTPWSI